MVSESVSLKFIFWRIFVFDLISHWVFPGIWPWMPAANFSPSSTVESSVVRKIRERRIRRILFQKYGGQFPRTYGHHPKPSAFLSRRVEEWRETSRFNALKIHIQVLVNIWTRISPAVCGLQLAMMSIVAFFFGKLSHIQCFLAVAINITAWSFRRPSIQRYFQGSAEWTGSIQRTKLLGRFADPWLILCWSCRIVLDHM